MYLPANKSKGPKHVSNDEVSIGDTRVHHEVTLALLQELLEVLDELWQPFLVKLLLLLSLLGLILLKGKANDLCYGKANG